MELKLLSAILKSRTVYEQAAAHLDLKQYTEEFKHLLDEIKHYYASDADASDVDVEVLKSTISKTVASDKTFRRIADIVDSAHSLYVSIPNISAFILETKKYETETKLATALINHNDEEIAKLLDDYMIVREAVEIEEVDQHGITAYNNVNIAELIGEKLDESKQIKVLPVDLAKRIGGGVSGGHHVLVFGPPEVGKSALAITIASGFLRQGLPGLYVENEEPARDTIARFVYNLTGLDKYQIAADPEEANARASKRGYSGLTVLDLPGGTVAQLDAAIRQYKPKWMAVNQLLNLNVKAENEATKLKNAAQAMRYLAKKYNMVVISVSQADGKAIGKRVLELGDVYYSNIAVQGAVDLMIGVGMDAELEAAGMRCLSLPKNKIGGDHGYVMVRIHPQLSKMESFQQ